MKPVHNKKLILESVQTHFHSTLPLGYTSYFTESILLFIPVEVMLFETIPDITA